MKLNKLISAILTTMLWLSGTIHAQAQQPRSGSSKAGGSVSGDNSIDPSTLLARVWRGRRAGLSLMPSSRHANLAVPAVSINPAVHGTGTVGKISMWVDIRPNEDSILGDSIITQSNGNIGIGLATPLSKLSVEGMIETTLGGYKFPDGTVQTTAAVSGLQSVAHDSTLAGNGTTASPLGLALPLILIGATVGPPFVSLPLLDVRNTADRGLGILAVGGAGGAGVFAAGGERDESGFGGAGVVAQGARELNGSVPGEGVFAFGGHSSSTVGLAGGPGLRALGGNSRTGFGGEGVFAMGGSSQDSVGGIGIRVIGGRSGGGSGPGAAGIEATGGAGNVGTRRGGSGLHAKGGDTHDAQAGDGVLASGGHSNDGPSGDGVVATGGTSDSGFGGHGVVANGANPNGKGVVATGGIGSVGFGVQATGGASTGSGSTAGAGVFAKGGPSSGPNSQSGFGIIATAGDATNGAARGRAGAFEGEVTISEHLTVFGNLDVQGTKNFKIDHPLDPENKYLLHASVESSEVLNVYSGNVVTDSNGEATVTLPDWFETLNRDLRYQLTVIGTFAQAIISNEVRNNRFTIKTTGPSIKVSWQVTGVRSDRAMQKQPFKAEEDKPDRERGHYLQPELYGQPEERSVEWSRHPELMRQLRQQAQKQSKHIVR